MNITAVIIAGMVCITLVIISWINKDKPRKKI